MQDYYIGERIYELRKKKGLSQKELGALVGVSNKAVSKWETGAAAPKTETIIKLASALDITVEELLSRKQPEIEKTDTLDALSEKTANLFLKNKVRAYENINENEELKKVKIYLICVISLFAAVTVLLSVMLWIGNGITPYFSVDVEDNISAAECIFSAMGMGYVLCGVYTGIMLFVRFVRKIPGWVTALLCVFFLVTFLFIEITGLIMVLPEIVISVRTLAERGKHKNE